MIVNPWKEHGASGTAYRISESGRIVGEIRHGSDVTYHAYYKDELIGRYLDVDRAIEEVDNRIAGRS